MRSRAGAHTNYIENCSPLHRSAKLFHTRISTSLSPVCIENLGVYLSLALTLTKMASFTSPPLKPTTTASSTSPPLEPAGAGFIAPLGCAPHLRQAYEKAVNAHPIAWRREPISGEVFKDLAEAERRLKYYSLAAGFDIVRGSGGTRTSPGAVFLCLYHGQQTRNFRGLEDSVMRDKDSTIVSRRQRESTSIRQRGCPWSIRVN